MASSSIEMLKRTSTNKESDERYTPEIALYPLLDYLEVDKIIYEPTSDNSKNIVNFFRKRGFEIAESNGRDFLKDDIPDSIDIIITNPPYSIKDKFLQRAYEIGKPFCFLLPVTALQGINRGRLFRKYGIQLLVLDRRIDFTGKGSPHFGVAWFCWKVLPKELIFYEVSRK